MRLISGLIELSPHFTPLLSTCGGVLIGAATTLHLYSSGRVTGMSGIYAGLVQPLWSQQAKQTLIAHPWKLVMTSGLLLGGLACSHIVPHQFGVSGQLIDPSLASQFASVPQLSIPAIIASGLLIGMGTRAANGCTSGHGVCGLPRLSVRSFAAVCTFMTSGMLTASLKDQIPFVRDWLYTKPLSTITQASSTAATPGVANVSESLSLMTTAVPFNDVIIALLSAGMVWRALYYMNTHHPHHNDSHQPNTTTSSTSSTSSTTAASTITTPQHHTPAIHKTTKFRKYAEVVTTFLSGNIFAIGLCLSGMADPFKVSSFLNLSGNQPWDPSLIFVMGGAVTFNIILWRLILARPTPWLRATWEVPNRNDIDKSLLIGSTLFGMGWGLGGVCPGPIIVGLTTGAASAWLWMVSLTAGMWTHDSWLHSKLVHPKSIASSTTAAANVTISNDVKKK